MFLYLCPHSLPPPSLFGLFHHAYMCLRTNGVFVSASPSALCVAHLPLFLALQDRPQTAKAKPHTQNESILLYYDEIVVSAFFLIRLAAIHHLRSKRVCITFCSVYHSLFAPRLVRMLHVLPSIQVHCPFCVLSVFCPIIAAVIAIMQQCQ